MTLTPAQSTFLVSLIALVGLIVLVAMGKVTADVGVPLIGTLGGAHLGAGAALSLPGAPTLPVSPVVPATPASVAPVRSEQP